MARRGMGKSAREQSAGADSASHGSGDLFTKEFLKGLRLKAIRRRVWFGLDSLDRGIFNLVTQVVDRVESSVLGSVLVEIVRKLRDAMKGEFARRMEDFGLRRAREVAGQAVKWGNKAAMWWVSDMGFVRYLTIVDYNIPSGYGI